MAIYVNERVCTSSDDIESFSPYSEPDNKSGEFQFIKIMNCKGHRKSVILGNVYRSPSAKAEQFNKLYDKFYKNSTIIAILTKLSIL